MDKQMKEIWQKMVALAIYAELSDEDNFTPMTLAQFLESEHNPFPGVSVSNVENIELYRAGYNVVMCKKADLATFVEPPVALRYGKMMCVLGEWQFVGLTFRDSFTLDSETALWTRIIVDTEWAEKVEVGGDWMVFTRGDVQIVYDFNDAEIREGAKTISFAGVPIQASACMNLARVCGGS